MLYNYTQKISWKQSAGEKPFVYIQSIRDSKALEHWGLRKPKAARHAKILSSFYCTPLHRIDNKNGFNRSLLMSHGLFMISISARRMAKFLKFASRARSFKWNCDTQLKGKLFNCLLRTTQLPINCNHTSSSYFRSMCNMEPHLIYTDKLSFVCKQFKKFRRIWKGIWKTTLVCLVNRRIILSAMQFYVNMF